MLQSVPGPLQKQKRSGNQNGVPFLRAESSVLENYSNLMYGVVSELGFLLPDLKFEDEPLSRKYQPSLKFRECLVDTQVFLNKIFNESLDSFDFIRCKIGEWKIMTIHLLPILVHLVHGNPEGSAEILQVLEILNAVIFVEEDDDVSRSNYRKDLMHYNGIYKRLFCHSSVASALTSLLASTITSQQDIGLRYGLMKQITNLIKLLFISPEPDLAHSSMNTSISYGRKDTLIQSFSKCKLVDIIFALSGSMDDENTISWSEHNTIGIFENVLCVISSIFHNVAPDQLISPESKTKSNAGSVKKDVARKPIRHGRFSGSISVQLSNGKNMVIRNASQFASGLPGSLDVSVRRSKKIETKMLDLSLKKASLNSDSQKLYLNLSVTFLESYFNCLFDFVCSREIVFRFKEQHLFYCMGIATYFMEFCRIQLANSQEKNDYYSAIYGVLDKKFLMESVDYLHELVSAKCYPKTLILMPFYREILLMVEQFSRSEDNNRKHVAKNLQKEIFHNKNTILLVKRVVCTSKPVIRYFNDICIESLHVLSKSVEAYSKDHPYWYVSASTFLENLARDELADEERADFAQYTSDSNFSYESFIKLYASREIVDFYTTFISNCQFTTSQLNHMAAKFLHRLVKSELYSKCLMRPSLMVQLQKVIAAPQSWTTRNQDLSVVSNLIIRNYCRKLIENPLFLVESFFN